MNFFCNREHKVETKKAKVIGESKITQRDIDFFVQGQLDMPPLASVLKEAFLSCGTLIRPPRGCVATYFFPVPL